MKRRIATDAFGLTDLERAMLQARLEGRSMKAVAVANYYSASVASNYVDRLRVRFGCSSTTELVAKLVSIGALTMPSDAILA